MINIILLFQNQKQIIMSMDITTVNSRLLNSTQKRQIMWNIIEPGDPYDIRKSMIAKLPGKKSFMGDHLQLVCLLQAAEIERLCEYLDQYKLKFREVERRELDRHSYEVQIKELTQNLSQEGNFKGQNIKLRQFLRKQSIEFEQLKKKVSNFNNDNYQAQFSRRYEQSLKQIQNLRRQNTILQQSNTKMRIQFQQTVNQKNGQLLQLQRRIRQGNNAININNGLSDAYYKLEIQLKTIDFQNKRLKEINQSKNLQIQELQNKSNQLIYRLQEYQRHIRQFQNSNIISKETQNKLYILGQQIQRLNMVLRDKVQQINQSNSRYKILQQDNYRKNGKISQLQFKKTELQEINRQSQRKLQETIINFNKSTHSFDENRTIIQNYEFKFETLSSQFQRLNGVLKKKIGQVQQRDRKIGELQFQIRRSQNYRKELQDYRIKMNEWSKKVAEYQNKCSILSQEVERLNQVLKRKNDDIASLEQRANGKISQYEFNQKRYLQFQQQFKNQISFLTTTYQSKLSERERQIQDNRSKLQSNDKYYQGEIQRLNLMITKKNDEISYLQQQIRSFPSKQAIQLQRKKVIVQYESQLSKINRDYEHALLKIQQYQQRIILLSKELDRLNDVLKRSSMSSNQYQSKIAILSQQIERLNDSLRVKDNKVKSYQIQMTNHYQNIINEYKRKQKQSTTQLDNLRLQFRNIQQNYSKNSSQYQVIFNLNRDNENKIKQFYEENTSLTRKISQFQYQFNAVSNELQRLNGILKIKVEENNNLDLKLRNISRENDDLRRKISQYQSKLTLLVQQNENIKKNYQVNAQYEIQNYKKRIADLQRKCQQLQGIIRQLQLQNRTLDQQTKNFDQQLKFITGESQRLKITINQANYRYTQFQSKLTLSSRQIERLNEILQKINRQNQQLRRLVGQFDHNKGTLQQRFTRLSQQHEQLNKRFNQTNLSTQKLIQEYQFKLKQVNQNGQQYYKRSNQLQSQIKYLSQELQYANKTAKDCSDNVTTLSNKLLSSQQENQNLNIKIQELANANRRIGQYQNKLVLVTHQIQKLNVFTKTKIQEINILQSKNRTYENQIIGYQRRISDYENNVTRQLQSKMNFLIKENEDLKLRNKQLSQQVARIPELQSKIQLLSNEFERLNTHLRSKSEQLVNIENRSRSLETQLQRFKRRCEELQYTLQRQLKNQSLVFEQKIKVSSQQNEEIRRVLRQAHDVNRRIPQYEQKIAMLSQEVQRLSQVLMKFNKQKVPSLQERNRALLQENQNLKRKLQQFSKINEGSQETIGKLTIIAQENQVFKRKLQQFSIVHEGSQQKISKLTLIAQENDKNIRRIQQYQMKLNQISIQIQRLNTVLRSKTQQINNYQLRIRQKDIDLEQINRHLKDSSQVVRRIPQYENKINIMNQELQRLNGLLRVKVDQLNSSQNKIRMLQNELQNFRRKHNQYQNNFAEHKNYRSTIEQRIRVMSIQIQQYRRTTRQLSESNRRIADYQSKIALLSQQVQRIHGHLRIKMQQSVASQNSFKIYKRQSETKINNLNMQFEEYRRKIGDNMNNQSSRIAEYQNKIVILSQQIQRLNYVLKEKDHNLQNYKNKQYQLLQEIQRLNNTLRLKVEETTRWQQMNVQYKTRFKQIEQALHLSNSNLQQNKYSYGTLTEEYNKAVKHLSQYQQRIKQLYSQFQRLQSIIQVLKKQNDELKIQLQQFGSLVEKNRLLSLQIDRLSVLNQQQTKDLYEMRLILSQDSSLQKRVNEDMGLMVVLFAQIESLRKRVNETEKQIETVRKSSLAPLKI